jgi:hypothetical protein
VRPSSIAIKFLRFGRVCSGRGCRWCLRTAGGSGTSGCRCWVEEQGAPACVQWPSVPTLLPLAQRAVSIALLVNFITLQLWPSRCLTVHVFHIPISWTCRIPSINAFITSSAPPPGALPRLAVIMRRQSLPCRPHVFPSLCQPLVQC